MNDVFKFLKIGLVPRLAFAVLLYCVALVAEIFTGNMLPGLPFILAAWFLLALKPASNKPKDIGLEEWRPVSDGEVNRISDSLLRSRNLGRSGKSKMAASIFLVVLLLFFSFVFTVSRNPAGPVLSKLAFFAVPGLFFGKIRVHTPFELSKKMPRIQTVLSQPLDKNYSFTPYLRFDKDTEQREIPENIRLMLEARQKQQDFIGVQFQISINNGANGPVPYMYAVVLTKGSKGTSYQYFSRMKTKGFVLEASGGSEYGTVVIRQNTGGQGYHTTDMDCIRLLDLVMGGLKELEPGSKATA